MGYFFFLRSSRCYYCYYCIVSFSPDEVCIVLWRFSYEWNAFNNDKFCHGWPLLNIYKYISCVLLLGEILVKCNAKKADILRSFFLSFCFLLCLLCFVSLMNYNSDTTWYKYDIDVSVCFVFVCVRRSHFTVKRQWHRAKTQHKERCRMKRREKSTNTFVEIMIDIFRCCHCSLAHLSFFRIELECQPRSVLTLTLSRSSFAAFSLMYVDRINI